MPQSYLFDFCSDFLALFPEIFLGTVFLGLICYGVFFTQSYKKPLTQNTLYLIIWTFILTLFLVANNPYYDVYLLTRSFILDHIAQTLKIAILLSSLCVLAISANFFTKTQMNHYEVILLFACGCLSLMIQVTANDFLSLYLSLEFQTLTFYVLAASKPRDFFSPEAGLKYFILGALSSGLLIFGFSLLYGLSGVIKFDDLAKIVLTDPSFPNECTVALMFIATGLLFKFPVAPFHTWAPDVYQGSPTPSTAFFATVPKLSIMVVFIRFFSQTHLLDLEVSFNHFNAFYFLLFAACFLSLFVGSFFTLAQDNIKRFFAYSSIGHGGFLLLGLVAGHQSDLAIPFQYIFIYTFFSLSLFSIILSLRKEDVSFRYLKDLHFLSQTSPLLAYSFAIILFSSAGIPPLAGFFPKAATLSLLVDHQHYFLVISAIILSCFTCFYSLKLIHFLFFTPYTVWIPIDPVNRSQAILLSFLLILLIFYIGFPQGLNALTTSLALSLLSLPSKLFII